MNRETAPGSTEVDHQRSYTSAVAVPAEFLADTRPALAPIMSSSTWMTSKVSASPVSEPKWGAPG